MRSSEEEKLDVLTGSKPERRYSNDWLRIFAMISVFLGHSARFFDFQGWYVKNDQLSVEMTLFVAFIGLWVMPLFFVLAGESANFSLRSRKSEQYISERFKRLIIPFIFGIFVVAPPQVYLERLANLQFAGSFLQFYPHYFVGLYDFGGNFPWMGLHLWYLLFLFIFSAITVPLFLHFKRERSKNSISRATSIINTPGAIFLMAVPVAIVFGLTDWLFMPSGPFGEWGSLVNFGGWNLFVYLLFFIYGYLLVSDRLTQAVRKHGSIALVAGAVLSAPLLLSLTSWNPFSLGYPLGYVLIYLLAAFSTWSWLVGMLGFASNRLNFDRGWLRGASEAVLPFYIIHQTVIVAIGFYVVTLDLNIIVKYLVIVTFSMIVTVTILQIIKRIPFVRFLFGMRAPSNTRESHHNPKTT